ncbi:MAG TPA: thiamine pyrophosphate-binding protein, partial [Mycobacterium sp.]
MTNPATTSEQIVQALVAEGVEYVFGIPGDENLHFMEALR